MKAFLDTSSLIKKYVTEPGSDRLEIRLEKVAEIVVAPIYWIELNSALERRLREKTLTPSQVTAIRQEAGKDLIFFSRVIWNESLEEKAVEIIKKYYFKALDGIQLAAAILSQADAFFTSDRSLYKTAIQELKNAELI